MPRLSRHSKRRSVERIEDVDSFYEAKRMATQAYRSGRPIGDFQKFPNFFNYLQQKNNQTNTCTIRIFHNYIYIWRGRTKTLVTVFPVPEKYLEEIDNSKKKEESVDD